MAICNVAFISQAKASSSKHKPSQSSGSYSSYTTSSSKAKPIATPGLADEVIHSFLATNADDVDLIHEDLDQIDDLDLEEMDINWQIAMTAIKIKKFYKKTGRRPRVDGKMHVAFDKRKVECFNCHNTGHFARECKFKGSKEGSRQEAGRGQDFKPVRTEKEALMTIDEGQINWLVDCGMSSTVKMGLGYGIKSNAEVLGYEEEISRGIFAFRESDAGNYQIPLYSRFKQVEYKGVPHPLSGDYTPREQEDIDDSLDGEQGTVSDHSVNDDPISIPSSEQVSTSIQQTTPQVPKPQQTVDPSCAQHVKTPRQPIRTQMFSHHLIPSINRQIWNSKNERDIRVNVNTGKQNVSSGSLHVSSGTHIKSGTSSFNTGKQHVNSGSMYVNSGTKNKSGGSRVNTGKQNVNSGRVHVNTARVTSPVLSNQTSQVNFKSPKTCFSKQRSPENRPFTKNTAYKSNNYAVKGTMGTAVKTSAGCVWRKTTLHSNTNSGPTPDSNVHVSQGPQGR
ncbi:ribonuclease H-like domain-containing protein [Tanacetum coccineum]|uniref:Ribonuclease H-like domain-containing protein n=1 Tax=Tanacetum coccineum TaxID=301880 RepID=A0ABQ4YYG9_9ASTR